jgi:hypothetical protein
MGALQQFSLWPWQGGLETSQDESVIPFNKLTRAQNLVFGTQGSRKKRDGINMDWDDQTAGSLGVPIHGTDFWYGATTRTQKYVTVTASKQIYAYTPSSGARSADLFAGTAWATAPTQATSAVLNNLLVIAVSGGVNVMKKYDGSTTADLGGTPPTASVVWAFNGRIYCNDKGNPDRLHWSSTFNPEEWNGAGDSGGFDIMPGDGDPSGITAIFDFKDDLYVAKRTKLYRIRGGDVEAGEVETVSSKLGVVSQSSVTIIEDTDVAWGSLRGFHLLSATDAYGDTESGFLSADIQQTFNEDFNLANLHLVHGTYLGRLNSIAFSCEDTTISTGSPNCVYLFNIPQRAWYVWTGFLPRTIFVANDSDGKHRLYIGANSGRLYRAFNETPYDVNEAGTNAAISMVIETGRISIDQSFLTMKAFKFFGLIYRPDGNHTISVQVTIDRFLAQSLSYSLDSNDDLLGSTFVLGSSALGTSPPVAAYGRPLDGLGRAFKVRIEQSGVNERAEIFGFAVGYEPAGHSLEVLT